MTEAKSTKPIIFPSVISGVLVGAVAAVAAYILVGRFVPDNYDAQLAAAYTAWVLFFFVGIGAFNDVFKWGFARNEPTHEEEMTLAGKGQGLWRYFRFTTDHKVVGIQYLFAVFILLFVGALAAFMIRLEQSTTGAIFFSPSTYNTLVGVHGLVMIATTVIMVTGPFGNFIVPIMIGARDMAFPRLNALSFWLLFTLIPIFLSNLFFGGFPTGWTGYAPLADQAGPGQDAYAFTIIVFAISSGIAAMNLTTTVITMRTKGMTWGRLPIFVWGSVLSVMVGLMAFPTFLMSQIMVVMDRVFQTSFFIASFGGSNWVYEHLFWFMGHPEVYVIALPSLAAAAEMTAVFSRKPVFGYKLMLGGMIGISIIGFLVWAHHLYTSGANTALDGPFMLDTELISIPTGIMFLGLVGTLWRGRIWITVPLLFVLAVLVNFVIGGVTGLYLADVPTDLVLHGSMFVTAHFHFTIVGGMVFGFFGAVYYWFPKMLGRRLNPTLGKLHFWLFEIGFLGTFMSLFYAGLNGEPRWLAFIPPKYVTPNLIASLFAILIAISVFVFAYNVIITLVSGEKAVANEWGGKTLEWTVPTPVPLENFEHLPVVTSNPYTYGLPIPANGAAPELAEVESAVDSTQMGGAL